MTKADKIEKKILTIAKWSAGIWAALAVVSLIDKRVKSAKNTIEGIGDVPVWNKRHIYDWIAYEHYSYPEKIVVNTNHPYYVNDGCLEVLSYPDRYAQDWAYTRSFSIRERDLDWLKKLCKEYRVEYVEL